MITFPIDLLGISNTSSISLFVMTGIIYLLILTGIFKQNLKVLVVKVMVLIAKKIEYQL